jgi:2-polyprenyl-3-methyl-5-hydroxy-6-metoxy-1,4-benzoquinol methylase
MKSRLSQDFGNVSLFYSKYYANLHGLNPRNHLSIFKNYTLRKLFNKIDLKNKSIIEIGCGQGESLSFLDSSFRHYKGIDLSIEQIKIAKNLHAARNNVDFQTLESFKMEEVLLYDIVFATCVVNHVANVESFFDFWTKYSAPGGQIIFQIFNEGSLSLNIFRRMFTYPAVKQLGFKGYELFLLRDHIRSGLQLKKISKFYFEKDKLSIKSYPFGPLAGNLNLFFILAVKN